MLHLRSVSPPPATQITATLIATALLLPLILGVGSLWRDVPQRSQIAAGPSLTFSAGPA
jgi:hypothetical protein